MRTADKRLSVLDCVVEALEMDAPWHVDQVLALEAALGVVKETDLKQLGSEVAELEGKER
ncbi:formin-like protein, partial [Haematococcus lacustris]